jgi:RNA polymerase sigma-70 factor (ECF subfamily)
MSKEPEELLPTRRSLLSRLKVWDDRESWHDFFQTYWKLIYTVAVRAGLNESEAQDVVQETIISVARQMPNFKYDPTRGSFKSWLFLITRRRVTDHFRKEYRRLKTEEPAAESMSRTTRLERIPDPAAALTGDVWEEEWKRQIFDQALKRVKRQIDPKQFQIFDCYVMKEWAVKDVTSAFGVNPNQVYLIKHRVSNLIAEEVRKLEITSEPASLSPS